jgi:hypothetical protein
LHTDPAARAIDDFLRAIGRDPAREAELAGTGARVAEAFRELTSGYDVDVAALGAEAVRRPVRLEYDLDLPDALVSGLVPGRLADRLQAPGSPARGDGRERPLLPLGALRLHLDEPETRRFVYWRAFLDAHRDCRAGRPDDGLAAIGRARALLGGATDPDLEELAQRCRPR